MRKVTIYGTLGPACRDLETLKRMFEEGMDGIRLNLSHMSLEDAADMIRIYHEAAAACGVEPELLIDMQGPELRIGRLPELLQLTEGELIDPDRIPFPDEVRRAFSEQETEILLDDGKLLLRSEPEKGAVRLRVIRGGLLESRKSIALPGCCIHFPAMTAGDMNNIKKAAEFGVTAVMQPFVRGKEDLIEVRSALDQAGCSHIRLFAKIENPEGLDKLEELIPYCDEIVIARGDLGNAMELWELPAVQKKIAASCRRAGRDFMVVTQMLDSMTHRQVPSRAEVNDIFNAVLDGASSVMVTGETAAGDYPDLAIRYLARTAREAEQFHQD